jgi:hypothetical protein
LPETFFHFVEARTGVRFAGINSCDPLELYRPQTSGVNVSCPRVTATTDGQLDPLRPANQLNGSLQQPVAAVIHKAMAIGRTQRFASASEMRETLRRVTEARRGADRDETLPPTVVDRSPAVANPKVASAPEPGVTSDAHARAKEAARLLAAEEAVRRAAQERERQEEEERERREAEEARRKAEIRRRRAEEKERERHEAEEARREAEIRRQREDRPERPPPAEPATANAPATPNRQHVELKREWKVLSIAIAIAATVLVSATNPSQYLLLGAVGKYLLFPFASSLLLGIAFGLQWPRKRWVVGLVVGISCFGYFSSAANSLFDPRTLVATLIGALAGAHLVALVLRRWADK